MKAYYFSNLDKKLRYGDERTIKVGITHEVKFPYVYRGKSFDKPTLCEAGLHGSIKALDALRYATGEYLWIVDIKGEIDEGEDKICGTHRTYVAGFDATELLKSFAKKVALINIEKIKPYCTEEDYDIIIRFLNGEESLRSAADAVVWAADTASSAANAVWAADTASSSAANAAWAAANAVWAADWAAVWAAEWAAANADSAADSAINENMNKMLEEMIKEELERINK